MPAGSTNWSRRFTAPRQETSRMADMKLPTPRVRIYRPGDDEPVELQTVNPDLLWWDRTRLKHRWPKTEDAPILWLTFVSWAAARRSKIIPDAMTYEAWADEALAIEPVTEKKPCPRCGYVESDEDE